MITEEHLTHWLRELDYQLNGILNEVASEKVGDQKGIKLANGKFVSFEYILEKANTLKGTLHCIQDDMVND